MRRLLTALFILSILAIGLSFTALNAVDIEVNYYFSTISLPLAVVVLLALIVGVMLGLITAFTYLFIYRAETLRLRQKVNLYEKEINNLREIPIKGNK